MRKKASFVILGILILAVPFAIGMSLTPQRIDQHAAEPSVAPSIPVAATLPEGCHYQEICPSCPASKECICHPQLVCSQKNITPPGNK